MQRDTLYTLLIVYICYRALAQKWHPDHYEGEDKEKAEKMFIDIAAAKEVLTDEGMNGILLVIFRWSLTVLLNNPLAVGVVTGDSASRPIHDHLMGQI